MTASHQGSDGPTEPITVQWRPAGQYYGAPPGYPPHPGPYHQPASPYPYAAGPYPPTTAYPPAPGYPPVQYPPGGGGWGGWPPPGGEYWPPPPPPRRRGGLVAIMVVVLGLLMVAAVGLAIGIGRALSPAPSAAGNGTQGGTSQPNPGPTDGAGTTNLNSSAIAAKVDTAVVDINTVLGYQSGRAAGTGVVIDGTGLVLTNNHVIAGSTSVSVTRVTNGRTYEGTVVGYDRTEDIAVVRMRDASSLPTAAIGDSGRVQVGDAVVAIGNAGGAGGTPAVAPGTVSGLNRSITASDEGTGSSEQLTGLIEVAADIQSGDSGGPLANSAGQVIGIDTAASVGFRYQASGGTGYAIPINQAMSIANRIIKGQASTTVHIGATGFLGVQVGGDSNGQNGGNGTGGAPVLGVVSGSPAEAAGLGRGDVITSVNGQAVDSPTALTQLLDQYHPGDRVRLNWTDGSGQAHSQSLKLATGPVG